MTPADEFTPGTYREIPSIGSPLEIMVKAVKARTIHELLGTTPKTPEEMVRRAFIVAYAALDQYNLPREDRSLQQAAQGAKEILHELLLEYLRGPKRFSRVGGGYGNY